MATPEVWAAEYLAGVDIGDMPVKCPLCHEGLRAQQARHPLRRVLSPSLVLLAVGFKRAASVTDPVAAGFWTHELASRVRLGAGQGSLLLRKARFVGGGGALPNASTPFGTVLRLAVPVVVWDVKSLKSLVDRAREVGAFTTRSRSRSCRKCYLLGQTLVRHARKVPCPLQSPTVNELRETRYAQHFAQVRVRLVVATHPGETPACDHLEPDRVIGFQLLLLC